MYAAREVARATPTCLSGKMRTMLKMRFETRETILYLTGVLVSPLAKKFGASALTITYAGSPIT